AGAGRRPGGEAKVDGEIFGKAGRRTADAFPAHSAKYDSRSLSPPESPLHVDDAAVGTWKERRKRRRFRSARNSFREIRLERDSRSGRSVPTGADRGDHRTGAGEGARASTGSVSVTLLGRVRCGRNRRSDGMFRGQCQNSLLAGSSCSGRNAKGQRCYVMTTNDKEFATKLTAYLDHG